MSFGSSTVPNSVTICIGIVCGRKVREELGVLGVCRLQLGVLGVCGLQLAP